MSIFDQPVSTTIDESVFEYWEKTKDLIDQLIDAVLNYRQSGHPGGSRSKVHILVSFNAQRCNALGYSSPRKMFW